jgi:hypothetical protein
MYKNSSGFATNQNQIARPIERGIPPFYYSNTKSIFTQIFPNSNILVIQEFRVSRYQVLVSFQCLLYLILFHFLLIF